MIFSFSRLPTQQIFCLRKKKMLASQFFSSIDIIKIEISGFFFFVLPTDSRKSSSRRSEKLRINYVWPYRWKSEIKAWLFVIEYDILECLLFNIKLITVNYDLRWIYPVNFVVNVKRVAYLFVESANCRIVFIDYFQIN